jgi:saccharopine dehydrogenase-like NADP-dependent oxidoreductase
MKITVLGAGMVGSVVAADLAKDNRFSVHVWDASASALEALKGKVLQTTTADLSDPRVVATAVEDSDLVVQALPGFLGFRTLKVLLERGRNTVDVSFMPEDVLSLQGLARAHGVTAVVDMGVAPGMSNLIIGREAARFDKAEEAAIYVGGLPVERTLPFQYKAPFSPVDVIEEYLRPSRFRLNGRTVVKPPLTDREYLEFPGVGTLEAFLTDGLRTLLHTVEVPTLVEKTMRYPGYAAMIAGFKESGFFGTEPVTVHGTPVVPLEFTSKLLIDKWKLHPGEKEFTAMRVEVAGLARGRRERVVWDLLEFTDAYGASSMARTTGYPTVVAAELMAEGRVKGPGILPPEVLGRDEALFNAFIEGMEKRNIHYTRNVEVVAN